MNRAPGEDQDAEKQGSSCPKSALPDLVTDPGRSLQRVYDQEQDERHHHCPHHQLNRRQRTLARRPPTGQKVAGRGQVRPPQCWNRGGPEEKSNEQRHRG